MSTEDPPAGLVRARDPVGPVGPARRAPVNALVPVRTVVGHRPWALVPRQARVPVAVLTVLVGGGAALAVGVAIAALLWKGNVIWWYWLGKGVFIKLGALVGALGAGFARVGRRAIAWQARRTARFAVRLGALRGEREGTVVRIIGVARPDRPSESGAGSRARDGEAEDPTEAPLVLLRRRVVPDEGSPVDQTWGREFLVDVDGSEPLRVAGTEAWLLDEPALVRAGAGTSTFELAIRAGERVEVIGILDREVDPTAGAGPSREIPMRVVLRGNDRTPLVVRRLAEPRPADTRADPGPVPAGPR